ncbi:MAG TPA: metallophosphoesterase [Deinococcales bacterium]|nr:metallophosphoesterase [Deinococcales bacterium]
MIRALRVLAALGAAGLAYGVWNSRRFVVTRRQLRLPGLRSAVRVVQLSDLHYGRSHPVGQVRSWVNAALALDPDLVLVTGDFVDDPVRPADLAALVREVGRLRAPLGVLAVLGNHDYHGFEEEGVGVLRAALEGVGLRVLVNEGLLVRDDLFVGGVDDLWLGRPDLDLALDGAPRDGAVLLMSHNPDLLPRVPARVGLTLSGHTHGGQVSLPVLGAPHSGSSYRQRYLGGFVRGPGLAHVSTGLGTTKLPLRFGVPAEVVLLELLPG